MIDMKLKPQQADSSMGTMLGGEMNEGDAYPRGLVIALEGEVLKRLAIGEGNLPQVGQKITLVAIGEVIEVCKEDQQIESGYCVEIQIQQMELGNEQQQAAQRVAGMYETTKG